MTNPNAAAGVIEEEAAPIGTGDSIRLQPYREGVQKTANGNLVVLETFDTFADVKIHTPNGLYEAKFAASELEAVIQLWGFLYGYPPALRPTTTDGR